MFSSLPVGMAQSRQVVKFKLSAADGTANKWNLGGRVTAPANS